MDLDFLGCRDLAQHFIEHYVRYAGDPGLLRVLDFYRSYRAYVRAKVTSFKLNDPGISEEEKNQARALAAAYFDLSLAYARSLFRKPFLVTVMGLPGVGKTYFAQRLAGRLNAFHLKSDVIRKELAGVPIDSHDFAGLENGLYAPEMSQRTYLEMYRRAGALAELGLSSILDATFSRKDTRQEVARLAAEAGMPVFFILCSAPEEVVLERIARRSKEPSASDATPDVYYRMRASFEPAVSDFSVDTSRPLEPHLDLIANHIASRLYGPGFPAASFRLSSQR